MEAQQMPKKDVANWKLKPESVFYPLEQAKQFRIWNPEGTQSVLVSTYQGPKHEYKDHIALTDVQKALGRQIAAIYSVDITDPVELPGKLSRREKLDRRCPAIPEISPSYEGFLTAAEVEYYVPTSGWDCSCHSYITDTYISAVSGLALSGGGYRAMLFHLGACVRLLELDDLMTMDTISSVSGGSIIAGFLATAWPQLMVADQNQRQKLFEIAVSRPVRKMAEQNIAITSLLEPAGMLANQLVEAERQVKSSVLTSFRDTEAQFFDNNFKNLVSAALLPKFHKSLEEALPDARQTNFIFCSCDANTGDPFYFSQTYVGNRLPTQNGGFQFGAEISPEVARFRLCDAIAASAAFPAFAPFSFSSTPLDGEYPQQTTKLIDGGIVDNLALEPLNFPKFPPRRPKEPHRLIYVSDAGSSLPVPEENEEFEIPVFSVIFRALDIMGRQIDKKRIAFLKRIYEHYLQYGANWRMEDLSGYFYAILNFTSPTDSYAAHYIDRTRKMVRTWRDEEGFPDLEELFGFRLGEATPNVTHSIREMIQCLLSVRTDMDCFYQDEREILETLGYLLTAYRIRYYDDWRPRTNFNSIKCEIYDRWLRGANLAGRVRESLRYSHSRLSVHLHQHQMGIYLLGAKRMAEYFQNNNASFLNQLDIQTQKLRTLKQRLQGQPLDTIPLEFDYQPFTGCRIHFWNVQLALNQLFPDSVDIKVDATANVDLTNANQSNSNSKVTITFRKISLNLQNVNFEIETPLYNDSGQLNLEIAGDSWIKVAIQIQGEEFFPWTKHVEVSCSLGDLQLSIDSNHHYFIMPILAANIHRFKGVLENALASRLQNLNIADLNRLYQNQNN